MVVFSDDPPALAAWYQRVFRCRPLSASRDFVGLRLGNFSLFIQRTSEGQAPGPGGIRPHLTVDDCTAAFVALVAAGARPLLPVTDVGEEWVAAVQDPEGNPIGLLSSKR